jgi:alpha-beta hydrolase superfamily lysophospholipase
LKPFYFGDSGRPLFGVHHPPRGAHRRAGVVICHPFGQEYLRAHRSLRELGGRLAGAGFHVLRFDYHGCGDSAGEGNEARLEEWLGDTAAAVAEIREAAGSTPVALVGLRLGATLAGLAASRLGSVEALVLWDPVIDGARYLRELGANHAAWMREHARGSPARPDEVLGFPLPEALAADLADLELDRLRAVPARRALVASSDGGEGAPLLWGAAPPEAVERRRFPFAPVWLHAEGLDRAIVPGDLLDFVTTWLGGACA